MKPSEIGSFIDGVTEAHDDLECKLGEVREKITEAKRDSAQVLEEVCEALKETRCTIEYISEELGMGRWPSKHIPRFAGPLARTECRTEGPLNDEYLTCLRRQIDSVGLRQGELEDEIVSLGTILDSEPDSDELSDEY